MSSDPPEFFGTPQSAHAPTDAETKDRRLLEWVDPRDKQLRTERTMRDSWRVLRLQSEFVPGFDAHGLQTKLPVD